MCWIPTSAHPPPPPPHSPFCYFGSPINRTRSYTDPTGNRTFDSSSNYTEIFQYFRGSTGTDNTAIFDYLNTTTPQGFDFSSDERYVFQPILGEGRYEGQRMEAVRTCNSFFFPQQFISESDVARLFEGMASSRVEREDFIITPDLRGQVFSLHLPACVVRNEHTLLLPSSVWG